MAAATTDLFTKVGLPGTATTLDSPGFTIGNTSINVASTSNWQTETLQVFAMDQVTIVSGAEVRVPGSYRELVGIVTSATSISSVSFASGFTPRNYPAGSTTRVYIPVTSTRENMLVQGLLVSLNKDGSLKAAIMPNYASKSVTNLWASGYSTTITTRGFVCIYVNAYAALSYGNTVTINGVAVLTCYNESSGSATGVISGVLPVNAGDVVALSNLGTFNAKLCNFIPERIV